MPAMNEFTAWHSRNRLKPVVVAQPASAGLAWQAANSFAARRWLKPEAGCGRTARFSGPGITGGEFIRCLPRARRAPARTARLRTLVPPRPGPAMNASHE